MFIEKKKIGNKSYYYARISKRVEGKVKTKTVAYLGSQSTPKHILNDKLAKIPKTKIEEVKKSFHVKKELIFLTTAQRNYLTQLKNEFKAKIEHKDSKLIQDMFKDFKTYYVYNTNAIEGNTLTLKETNYLLNNEITPDGKDLREIYDHLNSKEVFDYILKEKPPITIQTICKIHKMLLNKIDLRAGIIRKHNVRIVGADFTPSDAKYVKTDLNIILKWYNDHKNRIDPLTLTSIFHEKFERVHPFYDGNGRTGRMILNLILLKNKLPPLIIKNKDRRIYYDVLSQGHKSGLLKIEKEKYQPIVKFCYKQLKRTWKEIFSKWM